MDKMITMSLVVLICSIVVFFSKEFANFIKKIMAVRGMKLLLPLTLATVLLVFYENEVSFCLKLIQMILLSFTNKAASMLPGGVLASYLVKIILLMALSLLPTLAISSWYKRKTYQNYKYAGIVMALTWILTAMLLTLT